MSQPSGRRSIARSPLFIALAVSAVLASVVGNVQAIWGDAADPVGRPVAVPVRKRQALPLRDGARRPDDRARALRDRQVDRPADHRGQPPGGLRGHGRQRPHAPASGQGRARRRPGVRGAVEAVIHQVLGWEGASAVVCVVPDTTPYDEIQSLKLSGVHVVALDYDNVETESDLRAVRRIRLDTALGVICLETEPESFGHVRWIAAHTPRDVKVTVHLNSESRRLREIFEQVIRRYPQTSTSTTSTCRSWPPTCC